jgi:hypothetical protein
MGQVLLAGFDQIGVALTGVFQPGQVGEVGHDNHIAAACRHCGLAGRDVRLFAAPAPQAKIGDHAAQHEQRDLHQRLQCLQPVAVQV